MIKENIAFLQNYLNKNIPITKKLGLKVEYFNNQKLIINAPLNNNHNDKGTAFAGSLYSLAVLTGWGFISLKLLQEKIDAQTAVHNSNIVYNKPINKDFYAICKFIDIHSWDKFKNRVVKKSNGKISLSVKIFHKNDNEDIERVKFNGEYFSWINKEHLADGPF